MLPEVEDLENKRLKRPKRNVFTFAMLALSFSISSGYSVLSSFYFWILLSSELGTCNESAINHEDDRGCVSCGFWIYRDFDRHHCLHLCGKIVELKQKCLEFSIRCCCLRWLWNIWKLRRMTADWLGSMHPCLLWGPPGCVGNIL